MKPTHILRSANTFCMALALYCASTFSLAELQPIEGIAVIVDDDVILMSEYNKRLEMLKEQVAESKQNIPNEVIKEQLLDRLIIESLQLQMANRAGATIPDEQLNFTMNNIAKQNGMTLEQFVKMLTDKGESYVDLRNQVKRDLLIQRVQQGNLARQVIITEDEIDAFLKTQEGQELLSGNYKIDHLLLPVSSSASDEEKQAAEQAINKLAASINSEKTDLFSPKLKKSWPSTRYSDLGWRKGSEVPSLFRDIAPTLKVNQLSEPIRSASGWHLIKVVDKRGGSGQIVKQTRVRHILVSPTEVLSKEKAKAKIDGIYQQLQDGADFAELAKETSDDHGSALNGGDLDWQTEDALVPEFAQIMTHSKIGEISEPFESQFGWHILEVLERREQDVSQDQAKQQAHRILFEQKFKEELDAWLFKIRDEAYIDIKV